MIKHLILTAFLSIVSAAAAQWKTELPAAEKGRTGFTITDQGTFWVEKNKLYSASEGMIAEICPSDAIAGDASIVFANQHYGVVLVQYHYHDKWMNNLFETTDGGKHWTQLQSLDPAYNRLYSAINDPYKGLVLTEPGTWIFNQHNGAGISTDKGIHREQALLNNDTGSNLIWHSSADHMIVKSKSDWSTPEFKLHRTDDGKNWKLFFDNAEHMEEDSLDFGFFYDIARIAQMGEGSWYIVRHHYIMSCGFMYLNTDIFYTEDNGEHWECRKINTETQDYEAPADIIFSGKDTVHMALGHKVYRSTDGGKTWRVFSEAPAGTYITGFWKSGDRLWINTQKEVLSHSASRGDNESNIEPPLSDIELVLYPNPAASADIIRVNLKGYTRSGELQFKVYDMAGKYIAGSTVHNTELQLPYLAQGTYSIRFSESGNLLQTVTFIIQ